MARLRPIKSVRVLTVEEKTRVANLFTLLVEVNLQTGVTNKRHSPKAAKAKKAQRTLASCSETGCCYQQTNHRPIKELCNKASRMSKSLSPVRDLFLQVYCIQNVKFFLH